MVVQNGIDATSVEGSSNLPYAVPNLSVGLTTTEVKVPVLWWRSVGSTHTAYATEVFLDEVAEAAGADPVEFRLKLLKDHPRHAGVLKLAAEKAGWGKGGLPQGHHLGVSLHESFASYVAQVAEVSMVNGEPKVHRVVCAVDCGTAVNPDVIRAQVEGGIGFGLGAVLQEEITLTDGVVDQSNYDAYFPLRIDAMPKVEVHIVESEAPPTGIGEPGVPPIGPAVANAVYKATGQRVRVLPFAKGLNA
jgi:isoquinoline 1-oxidoreductase beta subunit